MSVDPTAIRAELKARLDAITGLQVHAYTPGAVIAPAAVISPSSTAYDVTTLGDAHRLTWELWIAAGTLWAQDVEELMDAYEADTGASSVKAKLEAPGYTSCDFVNVTGCSREDIALGGTAYAGQIFQLDIVCSQ